MSKKRKQMDETVHTEESRKKDRRLYCVCRSPDDPDRVMIRCDFCEEWYHPSCVNMDIDEIDDMSSWFCQECADIMALNPTISRKGLLGFQGRVAPKTGWCDDFPIDDIDERVITEQVSTKRHKVEGWNLFREGRVNSLSSNTTKNHIYMRSVCQAAMRQQSYNVYVCFKDGGQKVKWATCSCPGGIDGQCKHLVATLYSVIDLYRQGITHIPDVKTCTDKLQMWHVRKPVTDEPLLFSDITFVKHDPDKQVKRDLCCNIKEHNPVPSFGKSVTEEKLKKLINIYDASGLKLPVLETIRDNKCAPVMTKQQSDTNLYEELYSSTSATALEFDQDLLMSTATIEEKNHYAAVVNANSTCMQFIEKNTRLQSKSKFWFAQREYRITASSFGAFCRIKETSDPVKKFKQKKKFFTTRSVRHGLNYEAMAFAKYVEKKPCQSCPVGLVVNPKLPFLAATPDRLVKVDQQLRLVEIKCPYSLFQRKTKIENQLRDKNFYLFIDDDGKVQLRKSHEYFFQVQCQLNLTGINVCDFVVFVPPNDINVIEISRDKEFFQAHLLKVSNTYFTKLLPHFVEDLQSVHV